MVRIFFSCKFILNSLIIFDNILFSFISFVHSQKHFDFCYIISIRLRLFSQFYFIIFITCKHFTIYSFIIYSSFWWFFNIFIFSCKTLFWLNRYLGKTNWIYNSWFFFNEFISFSNDFIFENKNKNSLSFFHSLDLIISNDSFFS